MGFDIITHGVPIMELMCIETDAAMGSVSKYEGPFVAGDPGICLNACVAAGHSGCYVGVIGDDALGDAFIKQMDISGIDHSHIRRHKYKTTALSLLHNFSDGHREFIFTVPESAAACLGPEDLDMDLINSAKAVHISGFALSVSPSIYELHEKMLRNIKDDVLVSFDPNFRKEVIDIEEYKKRCKTSYERCNVFFPSEGEASLFEDTPDEMEAARRASAKGKTVALKLGERGAVCFYDGREISEKNHSVKEIDPTGAGDTFSGVFIASLLEGCDRHTALKRGNAAGAICVQRKGTLSIAPTKEEIDALALAK